MKLVNRIMHADVADATAGCIPMASMSGPLMMPPPMPNMPANNPAYNASKAALNAYTEGLQHELRELPGCKVRAHLLVPGWVNSDILINSKRDADPSVDPSAVYFHESKPAPGAWMPRQVVDYLESEMARGAFYVICPDNEVDSHTDNLRMAWAMADIVERRPPLSRWHPDYGGAFAAYLAANPKPP